jgi:hypothetical protein
VKTRFSKLCFRNGSPRCRYATGCTSIADNPETVPYIGTKPPAKLKADVPRTHRTCALVGNGPGLKSDGEMGRIIDSHDAVFRFNAFSSLGEWVNFTGSKSTYRIFNKKRAETMSSSGGAVQLLNLAVDP